MLPAQYPTVSAGLKSIVSQVSARFAFFRGRGLSMPISEQPAIPPALTRSSVAGDRRLDQMSVANGHGLS